MKSAMQPGLRPDAKPTDGATITAIREVRRARRHWSQLPFVLSLSLIGGSYIVFILSLIVADIAFLASDIPLKELLRPSELWQSFLRVFIQPLESREVVASIRLSLISCTITAILSLWIAIPLGYLLSRYRFRGKALVESILDIPIVLPPLVIGLSLLILFQTAPGKLLESLTKHHMGSGLTFVVLPLLVAMVLWFVAPFPLTRVRSLPAKLFWTRAAIVVAGIAGIYAALVFTSAGESLSHFAQERFDTEITYAVPGLILAQFSVSCAFAVQTMRVTFDQISTRTEQVALTLGCSPSQAFWRVILPQAQRGSVTAATLAWARALGEFGPILVFAGATRLRTEVLPTTVFLELSVGSLNAAVAVSLLMIVVAGVMTTLVRLLGRDLTRERGQR